MTITPEILRSIADTLVPHARSDDRGERYICISASDFCCRVEIQTLLNEGGLEDLSGSLGYEMPDGSCHPDYNECAMPVRFMYLEFLALYLESEA